MLNTQDSGTPLESLHVKDKFFDHRKKWEISSEKTNSNTSGLQRKNDEEWEFD